MLNHIIRLYTTRSWTKSLDYKYLHSLESTKPSKGMHLSNPIYIENTFPSLMSFYLLRINIKLVIYWKLLVLGMKDLHELTLRRYEFQTGLRTIFWRSPYGRGRNDVRSVLQSTSTPSSSRFCAPTKIIDSTIKITKSSPNLEFPSIGEIQIWKRGKWMDGKR